MLLPNALSTLLIRAIVSAVLFENNVWRKGPKGIALAGSVPSAASCLHRPLLSKSPSFSARCGSRRRGRSSALPRLDSSTSVGNMLRCLHWLKSSRRSGLLLVPLVLYVHIIAGVGATGLRATLGADHPNCTSLSQGFPLFLLSTNTGGVSSTSEAFFITYHLPSEPLLRAKSSCLLPKISSIPSLFACFHLVAYPVGRATFQVIYRGVGGKAPVLQAGDEPPVARTGKVG